MHPSIRSVSHVARIPVAQAPKADSCMLGLYIDWACVSVNLQVVQVSINDRPAVHGNMLLGVVLTSIRSVSEIQPSFAMTLIVFVVFNFLACSSTFTKAQPIFRLN